MTRAVAGKLRIATIGKVPVFIHWSAPFGAYFFGGRTLPGALAWCFVVLLHEAGHAILARKYGKGVTALSLHAFGGECEWLPSGKPWSSEIVAWGGVIAQLVLFVLVVLVNAFFPLDRFIGASALDVLVRYNLLLVAFNLLPFGGLDGKTAWRIFGALGKTAGETPLTSKSRGEAEGFREKLASVAKGPYGDANLRNEESRSAKAESGRHEAKTGVVVPFRKNSG